MTLPPSTPPPSRKRGGQPGNRNALKHGYYARQFNRLAPADLANPQPADLDIEIALLRTFVRRVLAATDDVADFESQIAALRSITQASHAYTRLLNTRRQARVLAERPSPPTPRAPSPRPSTPRHPPVKLNPAQIEAIRVLLSKLIHRETKPAGDAPPLPGDNASPAPADPPLSH